MPNDEKIIAKIFVVLFVIELIGILLSLLLIPSNSINPSLSQFNGFLTSVHQSTDNITLSVSSIVCQISLKSNCKVAFTYLQSTSTPIVSQLVSFANFFYWIGNMLWSIGSILVNIVLLIIEVLGLLVFIFLVLLPSLFQNVGTLGYLLGLGYLFIALYSGYIFVKILLEFKQKMIG